MMIDPTISRRSFLRASLAAPAIISIDRLMPVRAWAECRQMLLLPRTIQAARPSISVFIDGIKIGELTTWTVAVNPQIYDSDFGPVP